MSVDRLERVNALLKRVLGEGIYRVMQHDDISPVLLTVTGVSCSSDLRDATVSVSVLGDEDLRRRAIGHLTHHARDLQKILAREVRLKFTPRLHFKSDMSLEKGDRVLAILDSLENPPKE